MTIEDEATIAELSLGSYEEARAELARLVGEELRLEAGRPAAKLAAIQRLMAQPNPTSTKGALHSASSAEAICETDPEYGAYLGHQRAVVVQKLDAQTKAEAAWLRCQIAIATMKTLAGLH